MRKDKMEKGEGGWKEKKEGREGRGRRKKVPTLTIEPIAFLV